MSETTFTFRVEEDLKSEFSTAAKTRDRSAAQLLRDFMRDFVRQQQEAAEHDAWFRRQVQIGLDSANAGSLIPVLKSKPSSRPSERPHGAGLELPPNDGTVLDARGDSRPQRNL